MVLDKADSISSLAFLRSLQASRSYISALVEDLKIHGLTEHPEPASPQTAAVLDQQLEDLFVPYFSGSSHIEREKRSLEELYSSLLFKFTTYHVSPSICRGINLVLTTRTDSSAKDAHIIPWLAFRTQSRINFVNQRHLP